MKNSKRMGRPWRIVARWHRSAGDAGYSRTVVDKQAETIKSRSADFMRYSSQ